MKGSALRSTPGGILGFAFATSSGEGITPESLERAVSLSHEKYCSVAATLNSEIEYETVLE